MQKNFMSTNLGHQNRYFTFAVPLKRMKVLLQKVKKMYFLLMPLAPGLEDGEALRETYFDIMMESARSLYEI